jgi:hypothetical protein
LATGKENLHYRHRHGPRSVLQVNGLDHAGGGTDHRTVFVARGSRIPPGRGGKIRTYNLKGCEMTIPTCPTSTADLIFYVLAGIVPVTGGLLWRILTRVEKKLDDIGIAQIICREELPKEYVAYDVFNRFLDNREKQWDQFLKQQEKSREIFWKHKHNNANGSVET